MRRLPLTCSFLAALSFAGAPVAAQTPSGVTVTGTITDAASGLPVAGAAVIFDHSGRTVWTDDHGRFVARVEPGAERLTVRQLGYADARLGATIADGMQPLALTLQPDPVLLKQLEVIGTRLESRSYAALMSVHAFETRELASATSWSVFDFLKSRGAINLMPCRRATMRWCVWSRGAVIPAQVYLDGGRLYGGIDELEFMPMTDLYRVEVYRRGAYIQVLTSWWVARVARGKASVSELPLFLAEPTVGSSW